MTKLAANSGDPDQTPRSAASDLGLRCLRITLLGVSRLQWVKQMFWRIFRTLQLWTLFQVICYFSLNSCVISLHQYALSPNFPDVPLYKRVKTTYLNGYRKSSVDNIGQADNEDWSIFRPMNRQSRISALLTGQKAYYLTGQKAHGILSYILIPIYILYITVLLGSSIRVPGSRFKSCQMTWCLRSIHER